jgi:hypothetical protein
MIVYKDNNENYPLLKDKERLLLNDLSIKENIKFNESWKIVPKLEKYPEMPKSFFMECVNYFTTIKYKRLHCKKRHVHTTKCVEFKKIPSYVLVPFVNSINLLDACSELSRVVIAFESNDNKILNLRRRYKQHKFLKGDVDSIIRTLKENNMEAIMGLFQYAVIILDSNLVKQIDKVLKSLRQIYQVLMSGSYLTIFVPNESIEVNGVKLQLGWYIDRTIANKAIFSSADEKLILGKVEKPNYVYMLNYLKDGTRKIEPFLSSMKGFL